MNLRNRATSSSGVTLISFQRCDDQFNVCEKSDAAIDRGILHMQNQRALKDETRREMGRRGRIPPRQKMSCEKD